MATQFEKEKRWSEQHPALNPDMKAYFKAVNASITFLATTTTTTTTTTSTTTTSTTTTTTTTTSTTTTTTTTTTV